MTRPLAERYRPKSLDEMVGQKQAIRLLQGFLSRGNVPNLVFYGPPGCGKTTMGRILARSCHMSSHTLNATSASVKDIRELAERAAADLAMFQKRTMVHIDEIHRLNRTQQDVLLPFTEEGVFVLAGSTTENPYYALNRALRSRVQLIELMALSEADIMTAVSDIAQREQLNVLPEALTLIARRASGDVRLAIGTLEAAALMGEGPVDAEGVQLCLSHASLAGDRAGNQHYDLASAYQKSLRGSDADAAIYYLARFLASGEDPRFVARRLLVTASEDVGNKDPQAFLLATAALRAVEVLGMPECRIPLSQATIYVARAPKSQQAIHAMSRAESVLADRPVDPIPSWMASGPTPEGPRTYLPEKLVGTRLVEPEDGSEACLEAVRSYCRDLKDWMELDTHSLAQEIGFPIHEVRNAVNHWVACGDLAFRRQFRWSEKT
ncbi:MAG: AAA family ATPase [Acidobacteria bacterium]|nr:AAA family ATPase [Acidobacteriota bacterium]